MTARPCHFEWADGNVEHGCTRRDAEHRTYHRCGCGARQDRHTPELDPVIGCQNCRVSVRRSECCMYALPVCGGAA